MAHQNQTRGEERIAAELLLKLGISSIPANGEQAVSALYANPATALFAAI
jgi:hypothetical protein